MSTALPKIDQATKPAGVAGQSRDDLDLFTGPGTEIVLTDAGVGATVWQWTILDQPPGAAASLSTPNAATTNLTNATVAGSYFVQLVVDGGALPAQVYRVVAGVQIDTPSWVTPVLNRPLRIPAKGETVEFNVESSPGAGPNTRGWAQELDHWFRAIASFGFGVRAQDSGAPVGTEPFYTINFIGLTVADAGGGVLDVTGISGITVQDEDAAVGTRPIINFVGAGVTAADDPPNNRVTVTIPGGSSGVDVRNEGVAVVPGGPWGQLYYRAPTRVDPNYFQSATNAVAQPGTGEAEIVVTAAHHQDNFHSGGIILDEPTTISHDALKCSVVSASNPMTLDFQSLGSSGAATQVVTSGAVYDTTSIPAGLTYSLPPTTSKALKLLVLEAKTSGAAVGDLDLAVVQVPLLAVVITDLHWDFPDKTVSITCASGFLSLDGGPVVPHVTGTIVRLYDPTGYYWIEVFCSGAAVDNVELWDITASYRRDKGLCHLAVAPYWLNITVSTWGVNFGGSQEVLDVRQFGTIGVGDLQDTAVRVIDRVGGDMQWMAGVVFSYEEAQFDSGAEKHLGSFALVPATGGAPLQDATMVRGGVVWSGGRRYAVTRDVTIAGFGYVNAAICICARVPAGGNPVPEIIAFQVTTGNPIDAVRQCLEASTENPFDPSAKCEVLVPLYFGRTNFAGTTLLADGRIDLRRDVAHHGQWTVASRDPSVSTLAFLGTSYQSRLGTMINSAWEVAGKCIAEFGSIAGAIAWHGAMTGSDNLTPLAPPDNAAQNYPSTTIIVIGDTLETFPIHLRNNITVRGEGHPFVFVTPSQWWVDFGIPTYWWTYFNIGDGHTTNKFVYNVELRDLAIIMTTYDNSIHGPAAVAALSIWAGDYNSATTPPPIADWTLTGTTQNVLVQNVGFDLLVVDGLGTNDTVAAIMLRDMSGPFSGGRFDGVYIRDCQTPVLATRNIDARSFNAGIYMHLINTAVHLRIHVERCRFSTNVYGVWSDGNVTRYQYLKIEDNSFETTMSKLVLTHSSTYGIYFATDGVSVSRICRNTFTLRAIVEAAISIRLGTSLQDVLIADNRERMNNGTAVFSSSIILTTLTTFYRVTVRGNHLRCSQAGIIVSMRNPGSILTDMTIEGNEIIGSTASIPAGVGIYLEGDGLTRAIRLRVERNVATTYATGLLLALNESSSEISVRHNTFIGDSSHDDSLGCSITAVDTLLNVDVHGNIVSGFRRGVFLSIPNPSSNIKVDANQITCVDSIAPVGSYNSRGIHAYLDMVDDAVIGLVISNNVIRNVLSQSAFDSLTTGGIVIENMTRFLASDVKVFGNDIMLHGELAGMSTIDYLGISGVYSTGPVRSLQINGNKIVNRAVRMNDNQYTGGVVVVNLSAFVEPVDYAVQINDNEITWCTATYADGVDQTSAGVIIDCAFGLGYQVDGNTINVQSIFQSDFVLEGCVHGIMAGGINGCSGLSITNNKIHAWRFDVGTELYGICGSGIWLFTSLDDVTIQGNELAGFFRKTLYGSAKNVWGAISVGVYNNPGTYMSRLTVSDNLILMGDGDGGGAVGPSNLSNGIRIGTIGIASMNHSNVSVCDNSIFANLDATGSVAMDPAAIAMTSVKTDGTAGGEHALVCSNLVERACLNGTTVHGILNHGWAESHVSDNLIVYDSIGFEGYERVCVGSVSSTTWANNRAGTAASPGTFTLNNPPYRPQPAPNNWTGAAFV